MNDVGSWGNEPEGEAWIGPQSEEGGQETLKTGWGEPSTTGSYKENVVAG